ncbi:hypothetical protein CGRA01v4_11899 [Colletotrichum graminicola]|nr:hypothetical protein CGRA01v4_11899 [Colletotrichum graminicola]
MVVVGPLSVGITLLPEMFSRRKSPCSGTTLFHVDLQRHIAKQKPIRVPRFCFIRTTIHPCLSHPIAHQPCCTSSTQGMGTGLAVSISRDDSVGKDEDDSFDPVPHGRAVCTLTCPGIPASITPPSPSTHHL